LQVEDTLFRLPIYLLACDSAYFATLLRDHDLSETLHLADTAVSSSAFANFLTVLLPRCVVRIRGHDSLYAKLSCRLRATPLSTLHQWTDVLDLSSKWGFDDIRVASVEAILPLASPVDKIVLGRTHGDFSNWITSTYVDLLEREDSLTVDEARRLPIEDVVALAKGRCDTRTEKLRPRAEIETCVNKLLDINPTRVNVSEAHGASDAKTLPLSPEASADSLSATGPLQANGGDFTRTLVRWISQLEHKTSNKAARACVAHWIRNDPSVRSETFLDLALSRGWQHYLSGKNPGNSLIAGWDVTIYRVDVDIRALGVRRCPSLYGSIAAKDAALRLVDSWSTLTRFDVSRSLSDITNDESWGMMIRKTQYLIFCAESTCEGRLIDWTVFAPLWAAMTTFFVHAPTSGTKCTALCLLQELLNKVQKSISNVGVSREMDLFYQTLEDAARRKMEPSHDALCKALTVSGSCFEGRLGTHGKSQNIIDGRHWP
jgi:hypothetical protein